MGISPYSLNVFRYFVGGDAYIAPLICMFFDALLYIKLLWMKSIRCDNYIMYLTYFQAVIDN